MQNVPQNRVTTPASIVGSLITQARTDAGLRQEDLALRAGITQSTMSRIERGSSHITLDQLRKIAPVLGQKPSQIVALSEQSETLLRFNGTEVQESVDLDALKNNAIIFLSGAVLAGVIVAYLASQSRK
jgi:transcriptional regulator with XRE-family HTH domain